MLDIKFIRDNPNLIKDAARKKHLVFDVHKFLEVDKKRLEALKGVENSRAKQNFASDEVAKIQNEKERETLINNLKQLKLELAVKEDNFRKLEKTWREMMLEVPNIPDVSVPEGINDADNVEVRRWGDIPNFEQKGFKPKNHIELLQNIGLVDFERGVKVSGFRGYFLKGEAAALSFALWQFAIDELAKKEFQLFLAPALVREENLFGTGHFPKSKEDVYKTQDELYLSGTAEIPMTGYHSNEVL
ncbi:MAG: serine--tRNA ligase, partial [Patescibacteria group bacterium]